MGTAQSMVFILLALYFHKSNLEKGREDKGKRKKE